MAMTRESVWNMSKNQPRRFYEFIHECMNASVGIERGEAGDITDFYDYGENNYAHLVREAMMYAFEHCFDYSAPMLAAHVGAFIAMYEPAAIYKTYDHAGGGNILDSITNECVYVELALMDEDFRHFEHCFGEITKRYFGE